MHGICNRSHIFKSKSSSRGSECIINDHCQRKENKTDADYKRITQLNLESEQRSTQLQVEYYKKFSQVLSAEKVERYRVADQKFNEKLVETHQQRRRDRR